MSFNDQVQQLSAGGGRRGVFKEGVKTKWLTGAQPVLFRILPAYNYEDRDGSGNVNPAGFISCRDAKGGLTSWGAIIKLARYVGHGHGKASNRRDFLSPLTVTNNANTFCPISTLYATAANYKEWQYLIEDRRDAQQKVIDRAALHNPAEFLVLNVVELSGGAMPECVLGIATKSTTDSLVSPHKNGLLYQRANNVSAEQIAANPLCAWAIGDVTHPTSGPVLYVSKSMDKGEYSSYQVGLAVDPSNQVRRYPIDGSILVQRYDLTNIKAMLDIKSDECTVEELVKIFNMRSPSGYHEYALLKLAFGAMFKIPEPPAAPMASSTIPAGMALPGPGGFGAAPLSGPAMGGPGIPGVPTGGFTPPPTAPTGNAFAPPAYNPGAPTAPPVSMAPGAFTPPAGNTFVPPAAPGLAQTAQNAAVPPTANAPAAPAGQTPTAPGDPIAGFNRDQFLGTLRNAAGQQG